MKPLLFAHHATSCDGRPFDLPLVVLELVSLRFRGHPRTIGTCSISPLSLHIHSSLVAAAQEQEQTAADGLHGSILVSSTSL